jgi:hypothetical protein
MEEFEKYNKLLAEYGGCLFMSRLGFGWYLDGISVRGFSTAKEAYEDACKYLLKEN